MGRRIEEAKNQRVEESEGTTGGPASYGRHGVGTSAGGAADGAAEVPTQRTAAPLLRRLAVRFSSAARDRAALEKVEEEGRAQE